MRIRAISLQLVLATCCLVSTGAAQSTKDKVGVFVTSLPYAALSLDNASAGERRSFLVGQDYAFNSRLQAVAGDFDGNGCDSLAIYVVEEKRFLVGNTNTPSAPLTPATFTVPSAGLSVRAITGDWDSDGDRPSACTPQDRRRQHGFPDLLSLRSPLGRCPRELGTQSR